MPLYSRINRSPTAESRRRRPLPTWQDAQFAGVQLANNFEGITPSGTTLTAGSGGNTGGISGNYFDIINIIAGGTVVSDSTHVAHQGMALQVATGATAGAAKAVWTTQLTSTAVSKIWYRVYLFFTAFPAVAHRFFDAETASTTTGSFWVDTTGKILARVSAGTTPLTSVTTIPLNRWFRVEGSIVGDAAVGQLEFNLFSSAMDGVIPDEPQISAPNLNTTGLNTKVSLGISGTAIANAGPYWIDDAAVSTIGPIGPVGSFPPRPVVISQSVSRGANY